MTARIDQNDDVLRSGKRSQNGSSANVQLAEITSANYRLRLAVDEKDVRASQLLRFMVFNVELREGLEQSYATCLDSDAFDPVCDHLLVEDIRTGEVIGTDRLQTGEHAKKNRGYYSEQEFDFAPYEPLRGEILELGRACVHSSHRTLTVLSLLWKGIANYAAKSGCRYLIGCSSLTSQDPAVGMAAYQDMQRYLAPEELRTKPLLAFACATDHPRVPAPKIPKLLAAYLTFGARICGPPAMDREFKTIDFLTLQDLNSLPAKVAARFLG
jgi:putative hemolysin